MANVEAFVGRIRVAPDLTSRSRIDGPEVVGCRNVNDPVDEDRRRFNRLRLIRLKCPREGDLVDVPGRDLREATVVLT
jgi:hypothetical protein